MDLTLPNNLKTIGYTLVSFLLYGIVAFGLKRTDFFALILLFGLLFICAYKLIVIQKDNISFLVIVTIVFRLIFGWVLPNLSQDFYRFIWDGRLITEGLNPYLQLPKDLILQSNFHLPQAQELFNGMGSLSATHYSNYPPINQLFFAIAGFLNNNSISGAVIVLRFIIILSDIGTLYFGRKLLINLGLEPYRIFWYLLNPLVIIELTGNLHFEGVMLFFFVLSMYYLHQNKWILSAVILGLSIATKLLPLLLLPIFFKKLGFKKSIIFYTIVLTTFILVFVPFVSSQLIDNYIETTGLWFVNFEFNASIYYVIRAIGFQITGYNIIHTIGKIIPIFIILFVIYKSFFAENKSTINLFNTFLIALSVYFFTATTVHPWYIVNLILIAVFTNYKFPFYWSFLIILSYFAYSNSPFKENLYLIFIEYSIVYGVCIYEIRKKIFSKK
jgi:alpha-1,6-mannosyltransferase